MQYQLEVGMKRMKILVLATAAQLCGWVSLAGEPGVPMLRRTAGQVQVAGWTGGGKVDIPIAPRINPEATSPVSEGEGQPSLQDLVDLVDAARQDGNRTTFQRMAEVVGIPPLQDRDVMRHITKANGNRIRTLIVRRRGDVIVEVVLASGVREDGVLKITFYVASGAGTLRKAVYKEKGQDPRDVPLRTAAAAFPGELRSLWQDYHRGMNGDK